MGQALGREVDSRTLPRDEWRSRLSQFGLNGEQIENWEEMQDGFNSGWIDFGRPGTEHVEGETDPATVFAEQLHRQRYKGTPQRVVAKAPDGVESAI